MRASWLVVLLIGCSKPQAQHHEPPQGAPTPTPPSDASVLLDASSVDTPAPVDALLPVQKRVVDEAEGYGTCKRDEDCVLSSWQPGCCTGSCSGYAISTIELARREKKENCPKIRAQPCPPPAPCPPPTHMAFEAFCKAGTCFTHRHVLPP